MLFFHSHFRERRYTAKVATEETTHKVPESVKEPPRPTPAPAPVPTPEPSKRVSIVPDGAEDLLRSKTEDGAGPADSGDMRRRSPQDFIFKQQLGEGSYSTVRQIFKPNAHIAGAAGD